MDESEAEFRPIDVMQIYEGPIDLQEAKWELEKRRTLLTEVTDTNDRINCWLLHKFRSSSSEKLLLASILGAVNPSSDIRKGHVWQEEVLLFLFFDSANPPPSAYEVEPTQLDYCFSRNAI
jgi:hypothetical protein